MMSGINNKMRPFMTVRGLASLSLLTVLVSCTDLSITRIQGELPDMSEYTAEPVVSLRAAQSPDNMWTLTFTYGEGGSSAKDVYIRSNKPVESSFTVDLVSAREEFVKEYSEATGIEYELLPAAFYRFASGDYIDMSRGAEESPLNRLTVYAENTLGNVLEPGRYLLPIEAASFTQELEDNLILVDVTVREKFKDPDGFELYTGDDMFTVFYLNTSAFDPRLAYDMVLRTNYADASAPQYGLGNIVNLRTSSVDYDESTGKVSVMPSADMRYILEHWTERVLPVQETGRKVCLCIEGGGKGIGFCNFTDSQIGDFVASVKRLVDTYGFDGINLWDRNSGYDKAVENGFPEMNKTSYPKLIKAIREALGEDRLLTLTDYEESTEYFHDVEAMGGIEPGQYLDYAWSGYCSENEPVQIVDPWHQGQNPVSELHPRKPIAGLSPERYGCVHATWYIGGKAMSDSITEWVKAGLSQSGITVYYDIRSIIQDKFEGGDNNPGYVLRAWFDNSRLQINSSRLMNFQGPHNPSGTSYNKWAKDW